MIYTVHVKAKASVSTKVVIESAETLSDEVVLTKAKARLAAGDHAEGWDLDQDPDEAGLDLGSLEIVSRRDVLPGQDKLAVLVKEFGLELEADAFKAGCALAARFTLNKRPKPFAGYIARPRAGTESEDSEAFGRFLDEAGLDVSMDPEDYALAFERPVKTAPFDAKGEARPPAQWTPEPDACLTFTPEPAKDAEGG